MKKNGKMTWEATIEYIRTKPEFNDLVRDAYFDPDLHKNTTRFKESDEFRETLKLLAKFASKAETILDIGCGNGISALNFAKLGYKVTAVEPDPSNTIGAGAVKILKEELGLQNLTIFEEMAENIKFEDNSFDVVYIRQAMHHAHNLEDFLKECVRVLKPKGLLLTVRDHVIFNEEDKKWFLEAHPLHKYYGGENAYSSFEYKEAFKKAGAYIAYELKHFDSVINYFPNTQETVKAIKSEKILKEKTRIKKKFGFISRVPLFWWVYKKIRNFEPLDEKRVPGRMYSYVAIKT